MQQAYSGQESTLSVIILNWNSIDHLRRCILSLLNQRGVKLEILVVDNGSFDVKDVRKFCSLHNVRLIENGENIGVAAARNQGITEAYGEFICTLDVDTEATPGALARMLHVLESDRTIGLCAPRLLDFAGNLQYSCRRFPTLLSTIMRKVPEADAFGILDKFEMRHTDHSHLLDVDVVIGACQMYRRQVIYDLGMFEAFSLFGWEDYDLCVRTWMSGLRVVYCPDSVIHHFEQRVARRLNALGISHLIAIVRFFFKHRYLVRRSTLYRRVSQRAALNRTLETHRSSASRI